MSGTRPNKLIPSTVPQESANAGHLDTELEIKDFLAGDTLTEFEIEVTVPYNSGSPKASIGIDIDHEKYLAEIQCDLINTGRYQVRNTEVLDSQETIKIYIDPDGATSGNLTGIVTFLDT